MTVGGLVDAIASSNIAILRAGFAGGFRARGNVEDLSESISFLEGLLKQMLDEGCGAQLPDPQDIWKVESFQDLEDVLSNTESKTEIATVTALYHYCRPERRGLEASERAKFQAKQLNIILADTENKTIENVTAAMRPLLDNSYVVSTDPQHSKGPHRILEWTGKGLFYAKNQLENLKVS